MKYHSAHEKKGRKQVDTPMKKTGKRRTKIRRKHRGEGPKRLRQLQQQHPEQQQEKYTQNSCELVLVLCYAVLAVTASRQFFIVIFGLSRERKSSSTAYGCDIGRENATEILKEYTHTNGYIE